VPCFGYAGEFDEFAHAEGTAGPGGEGGGEDGVGFGRVGGGGGGGEEVVFVDFEEGFEDGELDFARETGVKGVERGGG